MANKNLHDAKAAKKDEFYTRIEDISNELRHYRDFFRGKSVLCNCDDPYESNFFKYFALNFNSWGLRRLTATCYDGSPVAGSELRLPFDVETAQAKKRTAHKIVITEVPDINGDGAVDLADVDLLIRNRAINSIGCPNCRPAYQKAFREYLAQLIEYDKKFLIIGSQNAITNKEFFPLIQAGKVWLGFGFKGGATHFYSCYEDTATASDHRKGMIRVSGVVWYTNIDHKKRHEKLDLYKKYNAEEYPLYDNYNAINVNKTADIPLDYDGIIGVPVTFMDKYNPEQFEIIWQASGNTRASAPKDVLERLCYKPHKEDRGGCPVLNGKRLYSRIFIKHRQK